MSRRFLFSVPEPGTCAGGATDCDRVAVDKRSVSRRECDFAWEPEAEAGAGDDVAVVESATEATASRSRRLSAGTSS